MKIRNQLKNKFKRKMLQKMLLAVNKLDLLN